MKKKYFVAYRFSGEDPEILEERMSLVVDSLGRAGIEAYCNLFDQHEYETQQLGPKEIMQKAFARIDESDGLFVVIAGSEKSEGQLIELGYAIKGGKHIIVAAQESVSTYAPALADQSMIWHDNQDLAAQLEALRL